jgi:uncharacterized membrane protein
VLLASGPARAQAVAPHPIDLGTVGGANSFAIGVNPQGTVVVGEEPLRGFQWDDPSLGAGVVAVSASMLAAGAIRIRIRRSAKSAGL